MNLEQELIPSMHQFPMANQLVSRNFWTTKSFNNSTSWNFIVNDSLLMEFANICSKVPISEQFLDQYEHNIFYLPKLNKFANKIKSELLHGTGVAYISGLSNYPFNRTEQKLFYLAIGKAMGTIHENYGRLYNVQDQVFKNIDNSITVSKTDSSTSFHTDSSSRYVNPNFIGLLCLQPGQSGAELMFSSTAAVHELMRRYYPTALDRLYQEYIRTLVTPDYEPYENEKIALLQNRFPIFHYNMDQDKLTFRYMRNWIEQGHAIAGLELSHEQLTALDILDSLLESDKLQIRFTLNSGEMVFCNNQTIVHNSSYNIDNPENPRLLVRMWGAAS